MGIEYLIVNLDKEEFLDFDRLGFGTKLGGITSEPIASFICWLLVNPEGFDNDPRRMMGRWAGKRIEILGDEGSGYERQARVRKDFRDITVEAIKGFAAENPFERITNLQPLGLIDKEGQVVLDAEARQAVSQYWKQTAIQQQELDRCLAQAEGGCNSSHSTTSTTPKASTSLEGRSGRKAT
jgi:hypothetical protein